MNLFTPMSVVPTSFEPGAISDSNLAQLRLVAAAMDMQTQAARVRAEVMAAVQWAQLKREVEQELVEQQLAQPNLRPPPGLYAGAVDHPLAPNPFEQQPQKVTQLPPTALLAAALEQQAMHLSAKPQPPAPRQAAPKLAQAQQTGKAHRGQQQQQRTERQAAPPTSLASNSAKDAGHETMRSHLQALRNEDSRCIFIARRIGKLGFRSKEILERFFHRYGPVRTVLVAHSKVKPFGDAAESHQRKRPGNFGLVLMKDPSAVERILGEGPSLTVAGVDIQVQPFYKVQQSEEAEGEEVQEAGSRNDTIEDDCLSEKSLHGNNSDNTSTTHSGIAQHRQTSSASSSDEALAPVDRNASSDNLVQRPLEVHPRKTSAQGELPQDADLVDVLQELSQLTKETAYLAHWGQVKFKQLEEQCQQRAAQLQETEQPSCGSDSGFLGGAGLPATAATLKHSSNPNVHPVAAAAAARPGKTGAKAESSTKEKLNNQSKMRIQMACFSEAAEPVKDTLRSHLTQLTGEDEKCIFIARRINKLGFSSREILQKHFSKYGEVARVLVAHSRVRNIRETNGQVWVRPGGLGLIVMKDAQVVQKILEMGEEQNVAGHTVRVQAFQRPSGALEPLSI